ncbi:MAG: hypothetical protein PHS96_13825, partial [Anaerolineales bacterium]|nr:hypothetical protein [Anaerolineales bacterium]
YPWGNKVKGRVAGALYDLFDSNNEGFDSATFGFAPIADLLIQTPLEVSFIQFWESWQASGEASPPGKVPQAMLQSSTTYSVTIAYSYDSRYRLTGADYSSGEAYAYAYDKVGNRTSQTNPSGNISYQYDGANRLTNVGGVAYTGDNNGNLPSDGVFTYAYDFASRLEAATSPSSTISFAYDGLGNRYQSTVDGEVTTYTLDLAAALPQVLSDGESTYLYGLGRIAQETATHTEYFLPDALGSVRQLAGQDGGVDLNQSFDPFGNLRTQRAGGFSHGRLGW